MDLIFEHRICTYIAHMWSLDSDLVTLCEHKLSKKGLDSVDSNPSPTGASTQSLQADTEWRRGLQNSM